MLKDGRRHRLSATTLVDALKSTASEKTSGGGERLKARVRARMRREARKRPAALDPAWQLLAGGDDGGGGGSGQTVVVSAAS